MSSIEIGIRCAPGLRFITHLDIIRHASIEAQNAPSPLSIPLPRLEHTFDGGTNVRLDNVHVKPDALFGIGYTGDHKFFALEFDRSTEDVEPTKNLTRASWLRKILSYSAASAKPTPIYETYLKVPNLLVLCVFSYATRMSHVMRIAKTHATYPSQFCFKTIAPVDPLLNAATMRALAAYRRNLQSLDHRREVIVLDIDTQIARVKDLIAKREEIDAELSSILGVTPKVRKPQRCSICNEEGHSARTCPKQQGQ